MEVFVPSQVQYCRYLHAGVALFTSLKKYSLTLRCGRKANKSQWRGVHEPIVMQAVQVILVHDLEGSMYRQYCVEALKSRCAECDVIYRASHAVHHTLPFQLLSLQSMRSFKKRLRSVNSN